MRRIIICLLLFVCSAFADTTEMRTWTSIKGISVEARMLEQTRYYVILEREDGRKVKIAPEMLSQQDQKYIQTLDRKEKHEIEPLPPDAYVVPVGKISISCFSFRSSV